VTRCVAGTLGDCSDAKVLAALVERVCGSLADDLIRDRVCARQVVVKIKRCDFTVKQNSFTLPSPTCSGDDLAHVAVKLLYRFEFTAIFRYVFSVIISQTTQGAARHLATRGRESDAAFADGSLRRWRQQQHHAQGHACIALRCVNHMPRMPQDNHGGAAECARARFNLVLVMLRAECYNAVCLMRV
jgi:hypothetical protein